MIAALYRCLICCCCLVYAYAQNAGATWTLPNPAVPNVQMQLTLTVKNFDERIKTLDLPSVAGINWITIQRGMSRSSTQIINGTQTSTTSIDLTITVVCTQLGTIQIPSFAVVGEQDIRLMTPATTLTVQKARSDLTGNCAVNIRFEPETIVPGQTCTEIYTVYLQRGYSINDINGSKLPDEFILLGDVDQQQSSTTDARGKTWSVFTFRQKFTVSTAGSYTAGSQQRYGQQDVFRRLRNAQHIAVKPTTLTVSPLPSVGRPADFAGIVGSVTIETKLDRERVALGEGVALHVQVSGNKQLDLLTQFVLPPLDGVKAYPKEEQSDENSRTFSWDLVPEQEGSIIIPDISVSWFDPDSTSYRRSHSAPLSLTVLPGRNRSLGLVGTVHANNDDKQENTTTLAGITLPAPRAGNASVHFPILWSWWALATGLFAGCAATLLSHFLHNRAQNNAGANINSYRSALLKALAENNLDAANQHLHSIQHNISNSEQHQTCSQLLQQIEAARFGNGTLSDDLRKQVQQFCKGL